jgi:hypothetical protein
MSRQHVREKKNALKRPKTAKGGEKRKTGSGKKDFIIINSSDCSEFQV